MKKQLLMIAAIAVTLTASAQNKKIMFTSNTPVQQIKSLPTEPTTSGAAVATYKKSGNAINSTTNLSQGPNAFGPSSTARSLVWADPSCNAISYIHRNSAANSGFGISGDLNSDFSTDGGASWTLNLPTYFGAASAGPLFPARYPQGAIYNPAGNTVGANAYSTANGPTLEGSNGGWGGFANGSNMMTAGSTSISTHENPDFANGYYQYIPSSLQIVKNTGISYVLDASYDYTGASGVYQGNSILHKGTWSAGSYTYTRSLIPLPMQSAADQQLAWSDDGMIGYIVSLGHLDTVQNPNLALYPIVYKTTDGGLTWNGPTAIDMSPLEAAIPAFGGTTGNLVSTSFEVDAVLDANNNLHIATSAAAGVGNFSVQMGGGASAIVDIYTTDGGLTYSAQVLGVPMTGRGTFGDGSSANPNLAGDNRPQAARTWDGTKLIFTWFDTDTNSFADLGNTYPDAYAVAYNVTSGLWTSLDPANSLKTPGLSTMMFGSMSYYAFDNAGAQMNPCVFQVIGQSLPTGEPLNTGSAVDHVFSNDVAFVDADYTVAGTPIPLPVVTGINDVQTIVASSISLIPNPASGSTKLTYLLNSSSDVSIKVVNLIGATVTSMVQPAQSAGQHEVQLNVADLKAGVYFVNVTAKGSVSTSKLIIK